MGFASTDSTNRGSVGRISGCWTGSFRGSELRQFMDVSISGFWYPCGSWNGSPADTEGWYTYCCDTCYLTHVHILSGLPTEESPRLLEPCLKITALTDVQSILSSCFPLYQWTHYSFRGVRKGSLCWGGGCGLESVRKAKAQRRAWA